MSTYNLDLYFAGGDVDRGQMPGAIAYVRVQTSVSDRTHTETFVSHQCMGPQEFKAEIARLKRELDEIERQGIKKFRNYDAKTVGRLAARD